jgi:hypothetical protein
VAHLKTPYLTGKTENPVFVTCKEVMQHESECYKIQFGMQICKDNYNYRPSMHVLYS